MGQVAAGRPWHSASLHCQVLLNPATAHALTLPAIVIMKRLLPIILAGLLTQCQTEKANLDGHYVSIDKFDDNSYMTLDIVDSLVLINKNIVFIDQRDTIIINSKTNSFVSSTREMYPFFDFKVLKDTVVLHYSHDGGDDKMKFVRDIPSSSDYFSSSLIDIELNNYHNEPEANINESQIKNITIGALKKGIRWAKSDTIYIEYENEVFINFDDISKIGRVLDSDSIKNWVICLNLDKEVPIAISDRIKSDLRNSYSDEQLIQTQLGGDKIIYVKMTTAGNNVHMP